MVDLVRKPGVEISQVVTPTPVTPVTPTLPPCIVGPAYEVVEALSEGLPNSDSLVDGVQYRQGPVVIPASSFPTNHADIDEVSVVGLTDEISATLVSGSSTLPLNPTSPSAVLAHMPQATRPAIFFRAAPGVADTLKVRGTGKQQASFDIAAATTAQELVDEFIALGYDAALTSITGYALYVTLPDVTASYGPNAFIEIISGTNKISLNTDSLDVRVDGSGVGAKVEAGVSPSPYITYSRGKFSRVDLEAAGVPTIGAQDMTDVEVADKTVPAWLPRAFGQSASADHALIETFPQSVDFTTLDLVTATPRRNGDVVVVDGVELGMILSIQASRLELGSVDSANSTYNADGSPLIQRYRRDVLVSETFSPTYVYFVARSLSVKEPASDICGHVEVSFTATTPLAAPSVTLALPVGAASVPLADKSLLIEVFDGSALVVESVEVDFSENFATNDLQGVVDALNAAEGFDAVAVAALSGDDIVITAVLKGSEYVISINEGSTGLSVFETPVETAGTEVTLNGLQTESMSIMLDDSLDVYEVTARSNDIRDLIANINEVVGYPLASLSASADSVVFQSALIGRLSRVHLSGELLETLGGLASGTTVSDSGSGRPNPNIHVTLGGTIHIAPQVIRTARTGLPKLRSEIASGGMGVAVTYRGLRLDLSPAAASPGLLQISSISDLVNFLSPIDTRNPLALGVYYALLNAGAGQTISAIGVSDISSSEPNGTAIAYQEAAEFIEAHEIYGVVPLSHSEQVIEIFDGHVTNMSAALGKRERVLISSPAVPLRRNSIVASSGEAASFGGATNVVDTGDSGLIDALETIGLDTAGAFPAVFDDGTELVLSVEIAGEQLNYSVVSAAGPRVTVRTTGLSNADGFYSSSVINSAFSDATYSVFVRGAKLLVPGTNVLDRNALASTVRDKAQQYANSRQLRLFPDTVQSVVGGVEQSIPMFYYGCAIAGATANLTAETPFSRRSMDGFTNVSTYDLTPNQLDIVSAGNAVIEVESPGLAPSIRIQCTTAPDALETREYSIVKAVDSFAKTLRSALRSRIGLFNITTTYMDETSTIVDVICRNAVAQGLLKSATIAKLEQAVDAPDTILVEVDVGVLYPANTIKVTLLV